MSEEPKWTKAKWEARDRKQFIQIAASDSAYRVIANIRTHHASDELLAEKIADAHLIASAPQLYEALEFFPKHYVIETQNALGPGHKFCQMCGLNSTTATHAPGCPVFKAESALRAARGEK